MQKKFIILNKIEIFNAFKRPLNMFVWLFPSQIFFLYYNNSNLDEGQKIKI